MKRFTLLLLSFFTVCGLNAATIYVTASATGNGTSWSDATDLQSALQQATYGDQIWVAKGTYFPTTGKDRSASFKVKDGVQVYGGFTGRETSVNQRNTAVNTTVLSGEIGTSSIDDNSYTIVYTENVSDATVVDGFTIKGGAANAKVSGQGNAQRCGGAWFNNGANNHSGSNPTINNCTFVNNYAREGAGIYNFGKNGKCAPVISNCKFYGNKADLDGGAIFNNGQAGISSPKLVNCSFNNNEATYGGAILNSATYKGESSPALTNCSFADNISYLRGGSLYNNAQGGICKPVVQNCQFSDNQATLGKEKYTTNSTNTNHNKAKGKSIITVK